MSEGNRKKYQDYYNIYDSHSIAQHTHTQIKIHEFKNSIKKSQNAFKESSQAIKINF